MSTATIDGLSVRALVREISESAVDPSPTALTEAVLAKLGDDELREALRQVLPCFVRSAFSRERGKALDLDHDQAATDPPARRVGSSRWSSAAARYLATPLAVTEGIWKRIGELTEADCRTVAAARVAQAKATAVEGRRFELFALRLKKAKAATISDLPETAVLEVMRWEPRQ